MTVLKIFCFVFYHMNIEMKKLVIFLFFYFVTGDVYQRTNDLLLQDTFSTLTTSTRVTCCAQCDQTDGCMSVSYQESTLTCKLSKSPLVSAIVNGETDTGWKSYSKNDWLLMFRGSTGIGGDIYTAWVDGQGVTIDDVTCMTTDLTSCNKNYRNPIADEWTSIGMQQVKFAFYKNNTEAAFVIFNATGSDITNWFSFSNVIQSSWAALATDTFNVFSIFGEDPGRRFLINHKYGGCHADAGYSIIVIRNAFHCLYDTHSSYPQFLISNTGSSGIPETMTGMDTADVMAIFVK